MRRCLRLVLLGSAFKSVLFRDERDVKVNFTTEKKQKTKDGTSARVAHVLPLLSMKQQPLKE